MPGRLPPRAGMPAATARSARGSSAFRAENGARASRTGSTRRFRPSAPPMPRLLIVGLAPGLRGANRTGRPFTGDYAGDLLYPTLIEFGFARGDYRGAARRRARAGRLPRSPTPCAACRRRTSRLPAEINTCRQFLIALIDAMPRLRAIVALGRIAHDSTLRALGAARSACPFAHGAVHEAGTAAASSTAITARATTRTPAC